MDIEQGRLLRAFFRNVDTPALEPDDERYVALYHRKELDADDPVELLSRTIEWSPGGGTAQLFSGFRGTGKSTELRRLRRHLQEAGYLVVLVDVEDYLDLSMSIGIGAFLITIVGAFDDEARGRGLLPDRADGSGYWARLGQFLTRVRFQGAELSATAGGPGAQASIKTNLRTDPTFRRRVEQHLEGHLGALVDDVRAYFEEAVALVGQQHPEAEIVVLVDSVDHVRGTHGDVTEVQDSVGNLFAGHARRLRVSPLHFVYTVPPYLRTLSGVMSDYSGGVRVLRAVKVAERRTRKPFGPGLGALREVVRVRGPWEELLGAQEAFDRILLQSGGHLRDLLRILAEVMRRADRLPVNAETIDRALAQIRSEFFPIADEDVVWLDRIAQSGEPALPTVDLLPRLTTFLDGHLVLSYSNGEEWYDVHPLIRDEVADQADRVRAQSAAGHRPPQ